MFSLWPISYIILWSDLVLTRLSDHFSHNSFTYHVTIASSPNVSTYLTPVQDVNIQITCSGMPSTQLLRVTREYGISYSQHLHSSRHTPPIYVINVTYQHPSPIVISNVLAGIQIASHAEPLYKLCGVIVEIDGIFTTFIHYNSAWWRVVKGRADIHHAPTTFDAHHRVKTIVYTV